MNRLFQTLCVLCLAVAGLQAERPNILLVMTDDMGFSDLGCYGGEIETPTLDQLAADGLRFSQFYNTAKCHSSRVSLLTGLWCRQAGDEKLQRAVTIPEVLQPAGYTTLMSGKWHLTKEPTDFGFERYFGHLSGATNYFRGDNTFRLDGKHWEVPEEGFYTTTAKVDHALNFLDDARENDKPWFLYLAFNAPHAPLQPLKEDYERYLKRYQVGWDVVHTERSEKMNRGKLFGKEIKVSPRPGHVPAWDSLTPEIQDWESRRMAALAALVHRIDREMARLVASLKENGELENTLILFVNDNGACPYDRISVGMDKQPYEKGSNWSDSTGWAWARNTPFRYYKQNQFEGGIASPAIVHWPAGLKTDAGSVSHSPAHLVDVMPTFLEVAKTEMPDEFPDRDLQPLAGQSLTPIFAGESPASRPPIHFLFSKDRALRDGDWKLVSFRQGPWQLYNIKEDRTELFNVADQHAGIVERLSKKWHEMAEDVLRAPKKERAPVLTEKQTVHPEWSNYSGKNGAQTSSRTRKK
ncbi:arylsulfatase [Roseibacillus persicicus]|uniref:arylsulfatase n=1 Tax=Roseibacillus persicicus TaxID=454148 RepID=UPI00280F8477|nr:arylsulfatase [Roseibacillus persicicus]MDQ8190850.1 arylsulfatase [Roseibacillus persicicus]